MPLRTPLFLYIVVLLACGSQSSSSDTSAPVDSRLPDAGHDAGVADASQAGGEAGFFTWQYNGQPVGMYVPASAGKPLPIVMFLHGCSNDPIDPNFWMIDALNAIEPTALLLPFRPAGEDDTCSSWGGTYDTAERRGLIDAVANLDRVVADRGFDSKRQYIYGESMGGEGIYRLLVDYPTRFAGAIAVAGYTLDTGADKMAQTPLWIVHGSDDGTSPVENDRAIYQSILKAGGTQVKYTEYPGLDHVPAIEKARSDPAFLPWLLTQRRQ
jgi:predicted peptidase